MKRAHNLLILLVLTVCLFASVTRADPTNSTWNYALNGTDWKMGNCNKKTYPLAPLDITNTDAALNRNWLPYHWSFLPTF